MSSVKESAHRSEPMVFVDENSAHRSSSPQVSDSESTQAFPAGLLAPVLGEISAAWWELRRRYTMVSRSRRYGERERVKRFFTRKGRDRAMRAYLEAHRRVYRYWYSDVPIT